MGCAQDDRTFKDADVANAGTEQVRREHGIIATHIQLIAVSDEGVRGGRGEHGPETRSARTAENDGSFGRANGSGLRADGDEVAHALLEFGAVVGGIKV